MKKIMIEISDQDFVNLSNYRKLLMYADKNIEIWAKKLEKKYG